MIRSNDTTSRFAQGCCRERPYTDRPGFTLLELAVVLGVVALLLALLIPAVQAAREAARKHLCRNNLKQIGLAMHVYHDAHGFLPPGATALDGSGWGMTLLPQLDQAPLYAALSPLARPRMFRSYFETHGAPIPGCETHLAMFRCPSSTLPPISSDLGPEPVPPRRLGYGTSDYKGSLSVFYSGGYQTRFRDIIDGLSSSLIAAESSYPGQYGEYPPIWAGSIGAPRMVLFRPWPSTHNRINCGVSSRGHRFWTGAIGDSCPLSFHSGGVFFLFADGSVHFLAEDMDSDTYLALCSIDDGLTVGSL